MLKNIHRRKPVHSHSVQNQGQCSTPLTETERNEFEAKIERLKRENSLLELELRRRESGNHEFEYQVQSVRERLIYLEHQQTQMLAFFGNLLKKPGFSSTLRQQAEVHNKKRRLLMMPDNDYIDDVKPASMTKQQEEHQPDAVYDTVLNLEQIDKLESSVNFWAAFLYGIGEAFNQDVYDFGVFRPVSTVPGDEIEEGMSSEDHDVLSNVSSPKSMDIHNSSPKQLASSENPIDGIEDETTNSSVKKRANDHFWEQFLTETPAAEAAASSSILPESGDTESRSADGNKPFEADSKKFWRYSSNLDNLSRHFGNLTSTGLN